MYLHGEMFAVVLEVVPRYVVNFNQCVHVISSVCLAHVTGHSVAVLTATEFAVILLYGNFGQQF